MSTQPADRATAEAAVTELYRLARQPRPSFEWVPSPAAGLQAVRAASGSFPTIQLRGAGRYKRYQDWPVAARLAWLESSLRQRLDTRIGDGTPGATLWPPSDAGSARMYDPQDALLSGISARAILRATVLDSLHGTLADAVIAPLRGGLADTGGGNAGLGSARDGVASVVLPWHGQHDAHWVAYYDIRRRIGMGGYPPADQRQLDVWAVLAKSAGWWWPGEDACVMAERPVAVYAEPLIGSHHGERRLHRPDGPAMAWGDAFAIHVLHGTPVPEWVISGPSVELIRREPNIEVRRSAIERIGWDTYIQQAGLSLVASCPDPGNPRALLSLYDDRADELSVLRGRVLLVVNGSPEPDGCHRRYGINVPASLNDPVAAAGWTYGLTGAQYATLARRT